MSFTPQEFISDKSTNAILVWLENASCFIGTDQYQTRIASYLQAHICALCDRWGCSIDELPAQAAIELYAEAAEDTCDPEGAAETARRYSEAVRQCQQELLRRMGVVGLPGGES